jgi:hypothetical protein
MTLDPALVDRARSRFVEVFLREAGVDAKHSASISSRFEIRSDPAASSGLCFTATFGQTYEMDVSPEDLSTGEAFDEQVDLFAEHVALNYRDDRVYSWGPLFGEPHPQWPRDADELR